MHWLVSAAPGLRFCFTEGPVWASLVHCLSSRRCDLMYFQSAMTAGRQSTAPGRSAASRVRSSLAFLLLCILCGSAAPANALSILSISATADCDAVTGFNFSGSGSATLKDGTGIVIAWMGGSGSTVIGPFIPFGGPTSNAQWTVTDNTGSINIVPSTFASQCAPASLTVSAGTFNARIVQGGLGSPPTDTYAVGNAGGSAIYLPATPYFPSGAAFFNLNTISSIGPGGSANLIVTLNAAAFNLAPGHYTASIAFSNAADLSVVTTRQVHLTVVTGVSHDFNGDGFSDIAWRDTSGDVAIWLMNGTRVLNPNTAGVGNVPATWSIVGTGDFNGDGKADILWRDTSGNVAIWEMNGTTVLNPNTAGVGNVPTSWTIVGTGDFNGDGKADILWRDTSGNVAIWLMNGLQVLNPNTAGVGNVPTTWSIVGTGDFNGDGNWDILWRDISGNVAVWEMNGTGVLNPNTAGVGNVPTTWSIVGTGDFNGDGYCDILWHDTGGDVAIWLMNGTSVLNPNTAGVGNVVTSFKIIGSGDFNGDGYSDVLWRDTSGNVAIWEMNSTTILNPSTAGVGNVPMVWTIQDPLGG
jgi:hypothetical protein